MLNSFYESVQFSVNGLEQLNSQGGSAYQLTFDAKAYKNSEAYQTPKVFKVLEQTEKGLYGLVLTNGMYEYTMGKDLLGNKLTKEEQQASLFQSFGVAAGGLLASKASTQLVEKGAQAVTKKFNDMRNVVRTSKVTQYGKDIQQAMRKMPAAGIDKAKKMYDAVLDAKVPRFLPQEAPVGVSVDFAQQTVRDVLKSTAKDTMNFMGKDYFDGKRWRDARGRFIKKKDPNHVSKMENSQVESLKEDSKIDKTTHSISVVENNTNRYSGTGVKINSDLIKRYIKDVEMRTSRKLSKNQIEKLKEALRNKEYQKLSPIETRKHRRAFNKIKDKLIEEWEIKTGQKWPTYSEDIISENTGEPVRRKGDKYDAHHIIENSFRGEHEWWNIHPAKFPNEHQSGIHGTGSPANELFKGDN
ncbi:hypothetical protein [Priestia flexa]|uniref:hypothetical protein n=1 Tax=Priestia flexa TaxID=86664 RepID=UPI00240A7626|nr:hypothetical protein [Priestia flexa]